MRGGWEKRGVDSMGGWERIEGRDNCTVYVHCTLRVPYSSVHPLPNANSSKPVYSIFPIHLLSP